MLLLSYTSILVTVGVTALGALAGLMSPFSHARRQSLVGDVVGHAALPGVACMFLITRTTSHTLLLVGGLCSALCGIGLLTLGERYTTLKHDTLLAILLSSLFGCGLVVLTMVQKLPTAKQAVLSGFLWGSAATILYEDVIRALVMLGGILLLIVCFWRWLVSCTFDYEYAATIGIPARMVRLMITAVVVAVVIVGLPAVGMLLMSTLLIAPAAAMRQWCATWRTLVVSCMIYGGCTACIGSLISIMYTNIPTGAALVLIQSLGTLCSIAIRQRIIRPRSMPVSTPTMHEQRKSSCHLRS